MNFSKSVLIFFMTIPFFVSANQEQFLDWRELEAKLSKSKVNLKAFSHLKCFIQKHKKTEFKPGGFTLPENLKRCTLNVPLTLGNDRVITLIDYTMDSSHKRMHLIDRVTGEVSSMVVAHGRYDTHVFNTRLREKKNSIAVAKYYSNELGSNAPSSGFYIAGQEYDGKYGRSLILHGLEKGINDNACDRNVVIHKHIMVTESSVKILSSGCPMITSSKLDHVVNLLKGEQTEDIELTKGGSLVFIYSEREASWKKDTCSGAFVIEN